MRMAIGVLAAKAPQVLERTLSHWPADTCTVHVHVDGKVGIERYAFVETHPHARLISDRQRIFWGGFNMVEAELALMRAALAESDFDVFLLQSDDAAPLLTQERMRAVLADPERWVPFSATDLEVIRQRYSAYSCLDVPASNPQSGTQSFQPEDFDLILDMRLLMESGKAFVPELYWGSQWKCLARADVQYVLEFDARERHVRRSFKYSYVPDEMYINTILGTAPHGARYLRRCIWNDFSRLVKPYVFQSRDELEVAFAEEYMFARKIHDPALAARIIADLA